MIWKCSSKGKSGLCFLCPDNLVSVLLQDGRVFIWTCDDASGNSWSPKLLHKFNDVVWHVSWSITANILAVSGGDNKVSTPALAFTAVCPVSKGAEMRQAVFTCLTHGCCRISFAAVGTFFLLIDQEGRKTLTFGKLLALHSESLLEGRNAG